VSEPHHFAPGVTAQLGRYVYLLIDPGQRTQGGVFYVGKGQGNRVFAHLDAALKGNNDRKGDFSKLRHIRRVGVERIQVRILRHGLRDDQEAFAIETAAIDLLGLNELRNFQRGKGARELGIMTLREVNAKFGAQPILRSDLKGRRIMLIRVSKSYKPGDGEAKLYDAVRKWWRIAEKRRDLGSPTAPEWAVAVYGGVIYGVYRIDRWVKSPKHGDGSLQRWGFVGTPDLSLERKLCNRNVSTWLPKGAQTPTHFVNCE
jgi:hypothetical protein